MSGAAGVGPADWAALTTALEGTAERLVFGDLRIEDPLATAEGLRYLTRFLATASLIEMELDAGYPHFVQNLSPWLNYGLPNPDAHYLYAPVHGEHRYRISGRRGTARLFYVEVYRGAYTRLGRLQVVGGRQDFDLGKDGEVEIVLSRTREAGNWLPLPPDGGFVLIRQFFYDWETEVPGQFVIERAGATYPPPLATADDLRSRLNRVVEAVRDGLPEMAKAAERHFAADPGFVPFPPIGLGSDRTHEDQVGLQGQFYGQGHYRCGVDEAVVLEVKPPHCDYWSFQLGTPFWETPEWQSRQTSLNGQQAVLDADGVFRAVISHRDPGVPNWLDASGHTVGLIAGRYFRPDTVPVPTLSRVPLVELRTLLPGGTVLARPGARQESLRRRMLSAHRRVWH